MFEIFDQETLKLDNSLSALQLTLFSRTLTVSIVCIIIINNINNNELVEKIKYEEITMEDLKGYFVY